MLVICFFDHSITSHTVLYFSIPAYDVAITLIHSEQTKKLTPLPYVTDILCFSTGD